MHDPQKRRLGTAVMAAALLALVATLQAPAAQGSSSGSSPGADGESYRQLLAERAPAVVTIRFVLHVEFGGEMGGAMGQAQEIESEATGVVVDPGGLVLCSNTLLGGFANLIPRLMGGGSGFEITATPTDIEVLLGEAAEGLPARLIARDSDLDLAWLQIDEPGEEPLPAIDLGSGVDARLGEPFVAVRRLDKLFARAPALLEDRIGGEVTKPRRLWIPASGGFSGYGLPVFNAGGELIGVTVMQAPDGDDLGLSGPMASVFQSSRLQEVLAAVILPASEVARATALAREMAAEREGEAEDEESEAAESEAEDAPAAESGDGEDGGDEGGGRR